MSRPRPGKGVGGLARGCLGPDPGGRLGGLARRSIQAHTRGVSRPRPRGEGAVSQHALRQTPQQTATAVGGTHPTGMHSCWGL